MAMDPRCVTNLCLTHNLWSCASATVAHHVTFPRFKYNPGIDFHVAHMHPHSSIQSVLQNCSYSSRLCDTISGATLITCVSSPACRERVSLGVFSARVLLPNDFHT
jgi:hypothetical protein